MKWFLSLAVVISVFMMTGCGAPDAFGIMNRQLDDIDKGADRSGLVKIIDYFKEPGKLTERLNAKLTQVKQYQSKLEPIAEKDFATFKNLSDINTILSESISLATTFPENPPAFKKRITELLDQFTTLEKMLVNKYPQSSADLAQRRAPENPEYKQDKRILETLPTPVPFATPEVAPEVVATEAAVEPTSGPVKSWRDAEGNVHFGQAPPENVSTQELKGTISQGLSTDEAQEQPEQTQLPASGSSQIWTDEEGNVHMGSEAPEGAKTKKAEDIKMMITN
jgi:hypothetical protein